MWLSGQAFWWDCDISSEGEENANSLSLACILTFLGNFSVYTRTQTHTHTRCCISAAETPDRCLSTECCSHCHTVKAIHGALIPAVLCAAQLAGCRACLYNAAGPSTFHTPSGTTRKRLVFFLLPLFVEIFSARLFRLVFPQTRCFISSPPSNTRCKLHSIKM